MDGLLLASIDWPGFALAVLGVREGFHWLLIGLLACASVPIWKWVKKTFSSKDCPEVFAFLMVSLGTALYFMHLLSIRDPYDIKVRVVLPMISDESNLTMLMMGNHRHDGGTLYPIHLMLYLELTNEQDIGSKISQYSIDVAKTSKGPWKRLLPLHAGIGKLYLIYTQGLSAAQEVLITSPDLTRTLQTHTLMPHETVSGFTLFQFQDIDLSWRFYRFRIGATDGVELETIVGSPDNEGPTKLGTVITKEYFGLRLLNIVDLSKFQVKNFYDPSKVRAVEP